eukprot:767778-Hanusia_phi.AAC.11
MLQQAERDESSAMLSNHAPPMLPPGLPDLSNPFAALQSPMGGMKAPGNGFGMNFPGMDEATGPFGPEMNQQVGEEGRGLRTWGEGEGKGKGWTRGIGRGCE